MVRYTITPWRYHSDLLSVREEFYTSPAPESRRYAVDRVMAWKLRGNLPHAVESTALLTDAILHHSIPGNSVFSIRAVYSAAFSRFVTGFCDIGRNKERSLEPSSMLDIAKQLGMPTVFVALRHEATHEELPAMQRLVKATEDALQWLWNVYWSRLEESETKEAVAAVLPEITEQAREIFRSYRSARRETLRSKKSKSKMDDTQVARTACETLIGSSTTKAEAVAAVLVDDKLLLPSKREQGSPMDGAYMIWDDLLRGITAQFNHFTTGLIQSMLRAIDASSSAQARTNSELEGLVLWTAHLIDSNNSGASKHVRRWDVMSWVCTHPGHWTHALGRQLLESADQDFRENWEDILDASQLDHNASSDVSMADIDADGTAVARGSRKGALSESNSPDDITSWLRTSMPMRTPIGVVQ